MLVIHERPYSMKAMKLILRHISDITFWMLAKGHFLAGIIHKVSNM